jgi:hypothetical protein
MFPNRCRYCTKIFDGCHARRTHERFMHEDQTGQRHREKAAQELARRHRKNSGAQ